jgi:translation elongation factor EF-Ts
MEYNGIIKEIYISPKLKEMASNFNATIDKAVKELREKEYQYIEVMIWKALDDAGWDAFKIMKAVKAKRRFANKGIVTLKRERSSPTMMMEKNVDGDFVVKLDMSGIKAEARRPNWIEKILYGKRK